MANGANSLEQRIVALEKHAVETDRQLADHDGKINTFTEELRTFFDMLRQQWLLGAGHLGRALGFNRDMHHLPQRDSRKKS